MVKIIDYSAPLSNFANFCLSTKILIKIIAFIFPQVTGKIIRSLDIPPPAALWYQATLYIHYHSTERWCKKSLLIPLNRLHCVTPNSYVSTQDGIYIKEITVYFVKPVAKPKHQNNRYFRSYNQKIFAPDLCFNSGLYSILEE